MRFHKESILFVIPLILCLATASGNNYRDADCFEKWLQGYRLAAGRPQRVYNYMSLEKCQKECIMEVGCAALAFGVSGAANGTCELALRTLRDSRSTTGNGSIPYSEIKRAPDYEVYLISSACAGGGVGGLQSKHHHQHPHEQRLPLFSGSSSNSLQPSSGGGLTGVPIDCFYRLMSGKRLVRNLVTKAITTAGLQECQEACIDDRDCLSISYRYMVSGYTYNVANCELSAYHITNYEDNYKLKYDFVDDYDYDYFQREPHCKTAAGSLGSFGVCALVVKRGAQLANSLIKSSHETSTPTQCEFLCSTASRFRCRAFAVRHTTRGRDPFHRDSRYDVTCILYDVDISRLPQYDIVVDPDYDLYEMGRLMGAECVLQDQFLNRRPGDNYPTPTAPLPLPPTSSRPSYYEPPLPRQPYLPSPYPTTDRYPVDRFHGFDGGHSRIPPSGIYQEDRYGGGGGAGGLGACLVRASQDVYLAPEVTRATFPTKTMEECRIECIRSYEVLRFACRVMSFRLTSSSGGSCQISEFSEKELRPSDYVPARDRYEQAMVFVYEERELACRRPIGGGYDDRGRDRDRYYPPADRGRYPGSGGGGGLIIRPTVSRPYDDRRPPYNIDDNRRYGGGSDARYPNYGDGGRGQYGVGSATYEPPSYLPPTAADAMAAGTTTVNGEKCLRSCVQDTKAGFYYCIVDTRGTWDFCCRPSHFCGYSRGLSVPWCYVGDGPTNQVWRSCSQKQFSSPTIAYLHDRSPPPVLTLPNDEVASLSKDSALHYFKTSLSLPNEDFSDIDGDVQSHVGATSNNLGESTSGSSNSLSSSGSNSTEVIYGSGNNNNNNNNNGTTTIRPSRGMRINNNNNNNKAQERKGRELPSFTVVEVRQESSST